MSASNTQPYNPTQAALQNWHNQVQKLEPWEQAEIENVYRTISALLTIYQSSAGLAVTRAALEIGAVHLQQPENKRPL